MSEHMTLYVVPSNVQCDATVAMLEDLGVEFSIVDLSLDWPMIDRFAKLGFTKFPIVKYGSESWEGFQPERLAQFSIANLLPDPATVVAEDAAPAGQQQLVTSD